MTRIIAIRPEPGLSATLTNARDLGLDIIAMPLFEVRSVAWECPDPDAIDALLIGSANAMAHGGDHLRKLTGKPVYAVGETTANAARDAGFAVASTGTGGLQNVLDAIPAPTRLLRIAGAEHVPLSPPEGVSIHTVIAYKSAALPLPDALISGLHGPAMVLLHSAAAASHFAKECQRLGIDPAPISLAALGPRIAASAGAGWGAIHIAPRPRDRDLLEMVLEVCL
jgi:uroporphyrinogen-III synthase